MNLLALPAKWVTFRFMSNHLTGWLRIKYPQNYIIRNPFSGAILIIFFVLLFALVYKPLNTHSARDLSYFQTMALYSLSSGVFVFLIVRFIKLFPFFKRGEEWTFGKEILSIFILLAGIGVSVYFSGFFIEAPTSRWNFATFADSLASAFLIGIIPLSVLSLINIQYLLNQGNWRENKLAIDKAEKTQKIKIISRLKNEKLIFNPEQFIFAESDGNYVVFYLIIDEKIIQKTIRNSISNIEMQLSVIPYFLRVHRAFIVNLNKIKKRKGNTSGYKLLLEGHEKEIPVSRQGIYS